MKTPEDQDYGGGQRPAVGKPTEEGVDLARVRELVDRQAEDEGLWFIAVTSSEAYLQQELRKLHALIEATTT